MALIKCPGCGREISSFSNNCNYCGQPISKGGSDKQETDDNHEISSDEAKRFKVREKKSGIGKIVIAVIAVIICILSIIGRMANEKAAKEMQGEQESPGTKIMDSVEGIDSDDIIKKPSDSVENDDKSGSSDVNTPVDLAIITERFLMESVEGSGELYETVYYGNDSNTIKELLFEMFILKDAVSDSIDPENFSLSDFEVFYEGFSAYSDINIQDAGNYYLLTIDYTGLDDAENIDKLVSAGIIEWRDKDADHEGELMDAAPYIDSLIENGAEKGFFAEKEYASYFESGKIDNQ